MISPDMGVSINCIVYESSYHMGSVLFVLDMSRTLYKFCTIVLSNEYHLSPDMGVGIICVGHE